MDSIDISLKVKDNKIKIYINNILHLLIKHDELIGIQSWMIGDDNNSYWIEYTLKNRTILTSYNNHDKWKKILDLLDLSDICGKEL